jgi:hypothetical protein
MQKELRVAVNNLPPIPQDEIKENPRWREWFRNLGNYIQQAQTGNNVWSILQGGTGASTAAGARTNLGLGTMATQNANTVAITGGSINGVALTGVTIPYTDVTGLGTMATQNIGITHTITTAKLTTGGSNGSMTFTNGILTAQTQAT